VVARTQPLKPVRAIFCCSDAPARRLGGQVYAPAHFAGFRIKNNSSAREAAPRIAAQLASQGGGRIRKRDRKLWRLVHQPGLELRLSHSVRQRHCHDAAGEPALVGGALDGYSESGSEQDLSVGRRSINDLEERAELEFSTFKPVSWGCTVKSTISVGAIGLERLGNQTIDTVLLGQNLSFITPGQASAVGGSSTPAFNITRSGMSVSSSPAKAPR